MSVSLAVSAGYRRSEQPVGPCLSTLRIGFNPLNLDFPLRNRDVGRSVDSLRLTVAASCWQLGLSAREKLRGAPKPARLDSKCRSEPGDGVPVNYRRFLEYLKRLPVWLSSGNMAESRSDHPKEANHIKYSFRPTHLHNKTSATIMMSTFHIEMKQKINRYGYYWTKIHKFQTHKNYVS